MGLLETCAMRGCRLGSGKERAAVDVEASSGREGGAVRCKESRHFGDILRGTCALHRRGTCHLGPHPGPGETSGRVKMSWNLVSIIAGQIEFTRIPGPRSFASARV